MTEAHNGTTPQVEKVTAVNFLQKPISCIELHAANAKSAERAYGSPGVRIEGTIPHSFCDKNLIVTVKELMPTGTTASWLKDGKTRGCKILPELTAFPNVRIPMGDGVKLFGKLFVTDNEVSIYVDGYTYADTTKNEVRVHF